MVYTEERRDHIDRSRSSQASLDYLSAISLVNQTRPVNRRTVMLLKYSLLPETFHSLLLWMLMGTPTELDLSNGNGAYIVAP